MDKILRNELILELDKLKEYLSLDSLRLYISDWDIKNDDILYNLIDLLEKSDMEKIFDKKNQILGNSASTITYELVALWIVKRAIRKTSLIAVEDYFNYLKTDYFDCYYIMWLKGINVGYPVELEKNLELRMPCHIPVESIAEEFRKNIFLQSSVFKIKPSALLMFKFRHEKIHLNGSEETNNYDFTRYDFFEKIEDIRLLFTISFNGIFGIQSLVVNTLSDDNVPSSGNINWNITNFRQTKMGIDVSYSDFSNFQELYIKFAKSKRKDFIRNVLKRLNDYATLCNIIDKAVEIRIILEMLFTVSHEKDNSISKQLRTNISKKYGVNAKERSKLSHKTIVIYDWCSEAIHTGQIIFHTEDEKENFNILFKESEEIIRLEIIDIINNKESTWRK